MSKTIAPLVVAEQNQRTLVGASAKPTHPLWWLGGDGDGVDMTVLVADGDRGGGCGVRRRLIWRRWWCCDDVGGSVGCGIGWSEGGVGCGGGSGGGWPESDRSGAEKVREYVCGG
ncbi:hypothetical protein Tco_0628514 [Tanacetum coccineum]|uniref:Uncharacterized protein n=1 Tax=Tanacetum coccineum TaxID=301880 RepID=A0ABQ4WQL0_9ASTR